MDSYLDLIRRPEYTGENRCWACTVTNIALLAVLAGVLFLRGKRRTATAVMAGGLSLISLRGYLVPYTPTFAPRLASKLPVDVYDHDTPVSESGTLSETVGSPSTDRNEPSPQPTGETVLEALHDAGVVQTNNAGDIELASEFRSDWRREMEVLRERDLDGLAGVADTLTPASVDTRPVRDSVSRGIVLEPTSGAPIHIRRSFAIPELAATRALAGRVDDEIARAAGRPLRSLLEQCPLCDGPLTVTESRCCGGTVQPGEAPAEKLVCTSCNERFFTYN